MAQTSFDDTKPKIPRRKRGIIRVEALLAAASDVFIEKGFDATTTGEIAERAGSSIGSLYQFFPTKESIADVLRARCGDAICERWDALTASAEARTAGELAAALFQTLADVRDEHPSFRVLEAVRSSPLANVSAVRVRIMTSLCNLLQSRIPSAENTDIPTTALVTLQILRCSNTVVASRYEFDREKALRDLQTVLAHYLADTSGAGMPA